MACLFGFFFSGEGVSFPGGWDGTVPAVCRPLNYQQMPPEPAQCPADGDATGQGSGGAPRARLPEPSPPSSRPSRPAALPPPPPLCPGTHRLPGGAGHEADGERQPHAPHYSRGAGAAAAGGRAQRRNRGPAALGSARGRGAGPVAPRVRPAALLPRARRCAPAGPVLGARGLQAALPAPPPSLRPECAAAAARLPVKPRRNSCRITTQIGSSPSQWKEAARRHRRLSPLANSSKFPPLPPPPPPPPRSPLSRPPPPVENMSSAADRLRAGWPRIKPGTWKGSPWQQCSQQRCAPGSLRRGASSECRERAKWRGQKSREEGLPRKCQLIVNPHLAFSLRIQFF